MGKLKNSIIQANEEAFRRIFAQTNVGENAHPRMSGLEDSDEAWAQYEMEFNEWLDNYEKSFGENHD